MKASRTSVGLVAQADHGGRKWLSKPGFWLAVVLGGSLIVLFFQSFQPDQVLFVNDTTLGQMKAAPNHLPEAFTGCWHTGSWIGIEGMAAAPTLSALLALVLSPEIFLKIYAPISLFFVGFCAWAFFRQLEFSAPVCLLGAVAAGLNMHFFSIACWGLGSWNIAAGMMFLALAALHAKSIPRLWARGTLAGLAAGMTLMEGFDVGAILCLYIGSFIVWHVFSREAPGAREFLTAFCTEALVVFFSALIAAHAIFSLVGTQVVGVSGIGQDEETKEKRWDPATKWSLPKIETLGIVVPGLFGFRMAEQIMGPDKSSGYWGTVGQDPKLAELRDGTPEVRATAIAAYNLPAQASQELNSSDSNIRFNAIQKLLSRAPVLARYCGTGEYAGVMVSILALFAMANLWRGARAPFSSSERRAIWFWSGAAVFSLLAAWGRHGFLYRVLYQLPYLSTIRNPIKFMHPFHIAWLILAGYGMEALWRRYLKTAARRTETLPLHLRKWWGKVFGFERRWTLASLALVGASLVAVVIFSGSKPRLIEYLSQNALDETRAIQTADFSIGQARWFAVWLLVSAGAVIGIISGAWSGPQARQAWILLGVVIILDLAHSDTPWIHYFNYKLEYAENSVVDFLKDKPYEHRVIGRMSPQGPGSTVGSTIMGRLYEHWQQNDFPSLGIETLDFAQWARMPLLDATYMKNFALSGLDVAQADLWPSKRLWELTNTRYILAPPALAPLVNQPTDPRHTVLIKTFLQVVKKADAPTADDFGDMTAMPVAEGPFALMEFNNPLPRAKLYSYWELLTNDDAILKTLISHEFEPEKTVLVARDTPVGQPAGDAMLDPGTVSITDYRPKRVTLQASAARPAVLLLNDRIAPSWRVRVDQKPAPLLRCNYLMRGVLLTPGEHTVEFRFQPPLTALYLSLCGWAVGILTAGYLIYSRKSVPRPVQTSTLIIQETAAGSQQQRKR
ncbi:MAG: hypothetical protein ABSA83_13305 [Verrucomicrobiota bacterium]